MSDGDDLDNYGVHECTAEHPGGKHSVCPHLEQRLLALEARLDMPTDLLQQLYQRWEKMPTKDILEENAYIFHLAVVLTNQRRAAEE